MKISNTKNGKITKKKALVSVLMCVVLAASGYAIYHFLSNKNQDITTVNNSGQSEKSDSTTESSQQKTNTEVKKESTNSDPQAQTTVNKETNKTIVSVVTSVNVTDGLVYIRGGINNAISGGNCYALLKNSSGVSIKKESDLLPNPGTTDCKTIVIPVSDLSSGSWTYTLNYSSSTHEGVSSENSFQID